MNNIENMLGALYSGNKEKAVESFNDAISDKVSHAVDVKKVAVTADIFNARNVKG